jgi:hypothetical protein
MTGLLRLLATLSLSWNFGTQLLQASRSQSHVTTDDQSASLSWNKAPHLGLKTRFSLLPDHCGFLMWGALSDERTGLSFTMYNVQYILLSQI